MKYLLTLCLAALLLFGQRSYGKDPAKQTQWIGQMTVEIDQKDKTKWLKLRVSKEDEYELVIKNVRSKNQIIHLYENTKPEVIAYGVLGEDAKAKILSKKCIFLHTLEITKDNVHE